jgi:hypothetical protein
VANDMREWEICDAIGKEDIDGLPQCWVLWSATLVADMKWGREGYGNRFEAGLLVRQLIA